jgi:nicotinamide-nucleotide amidase
MLPEATLEQARGLLALMDSKGMTLATAESCTGGLIAAAVTAIAGSSSVVMAGFVTYANDAKHKMVGVRQESLTQHGAVSAEVAQEMAEGARTRAGVSLALSCTGIAGPGQASRWGWFSSAARAKVRPRWWNAMSSQVIARRCVRRPWLRRLIWPGAA